MAGAEEKVQKLGKFLVENGIPSIGPMHSTMLLTVLQAVREAKAKADDPVVMEQLEAYEAALEEVLVVSAIHQKFVIGKLEALLGALE